MHLLMDEWIILKLKCPSSFAEILVLNRKKSCLVFHHLIRKSEIDLCIVCSLLQIVTIVKKVPNELSKTGTYDNYLRADVHINIIKV